MLKALIRAKGMVSRARRRIGLGVENGPVVLLYHRVIDVTSDPYRICVSPRRFSEHLQILRQSVQVIRLQELVHRRNGKPNARPSVVITFDDGYADNFEIARPMLEHLDLPATIFVCAGFIEENREFWWDELSMILDSMTIPRRLALNTGAEEFEWSEPVQPSSKSHEKLFRSLYRLFSRVDAGLRDRLMCDLRRWAGWSGKPRDTHRPMSREQVRILAQNGLIEIGAHSVTHPQLSRLDPEMQREEICGSRTMLEQITGKPVKSFSFPHGSRPPAVQSILRHEDFTCACSSEAGPVLRKTDPFNVPRIEVGDWDAATFRDRLSFWLGQPIA